MPLSHLPIEQIRSPRIRRGFEYWLSIRHGAEVPLRSAFDPTDIPKLLPYTYLTEIHRNPLRVRYRLVGTRICEVEGWDKTGHWMEEEVWKDHYDQWIKDYETAIETGWPLFGRDDLSYLDHSHIRFEWALMPLSTNGEAVDMAFELEDFDDELALVQNPLKSRGLKLPAGG